MRFPTSGPASSTPTAPCSTCIRRSRAAAALGDKAEAVSANGWDAAGAAHFGFRVAWLNRFAQAPERLPGAPAAVIESLAALPGPLDL